MPSATSKFNDDNFCFKDCFDDILAYMTHPSKKKPLSIVESLWQLYKLLMIKNTETKFDCEKFNAKSSNTTRKLNGVLYAIK